MRNFDEVVQAVRQSMQRVGVSGNVAVGLSGGADSVALLLALSTLRGEGITLSAIHVNHHLRPEAAQEQFFCQSLCERLAIPLQVCDVHVASGGSLEAAARAARYQAFEDAMRTLKMDTLALAHQMDDQAETVLMHLLYGSGTAGMGGMHEYRAPYWRPLLHVRRSALRAALEELGESWCEDGSNDSIAYTRNRLRMKLIPTAEQIYPQAVPAISRAADILREENECLNQQADAWLARFATHGPWLFLLRTPFEGQHPALQRRILRRYAETCGLTPPDFAQTEALRNAPDGTVNLPDGWHAVKTKERIHFLAPERRRIEWPPMLLSKERYSGAPGDGRLTQAIPLRLLEPAALRTRMPGDTIQPFGMQGSMKLKDYLISRGIDQPFRDGWPLLCLGNEVLWVIGVGASQRLRVEASEDAILMRFTGELPDHMYGEDNEHGA